MMAQVIMGDAMQPKQRAIILARVSSKAQEEEGYSLDSQLKLLRAYCEKNKLEIDQEFKIAETASKDQQRRIFKELVRYLARRKVYHFVVEKTDRLTRNFKDAVIIDAWLESDENRRLHMVKESLILHKHARSDAKFMWSIYLSVAKKYTDNLREEAMKGWAEKLAQGWLPAPPPPGYKTITENGKRIHVPDAETVKLVRFAFDTYLQPDETIMSVTEKLRVAGLRTRTGKPLGKSNVYERILDNPFYIGTNRFNGQDYPGAQEPIISRETFDNVQKKLHGRRKSVLRKHNPLFRGLIWCKHCGSQITWQIQKGKFYGVCRRLHEACAHTKMLREDRVEETIIRALEAKQDPEGELLKRLQEALQVGHSEKADKFREKAIQNLRTQLGRMGKMKDMLYDDKLAGLITQEKYEAKLAKMEEDKIAAEERLQLLYEAQGRGKPAETPPMSDNPIVDLYLKSGVQQKRMIMTMIFGELYADGDNVPIW